MCLWKRESGVEDSGYAERVKGGGGVVVVIIFSFNHGNRNKVNHNY